MLLYASMICEHTPAPQQTSATTIGEIPPVSYESNEYIIPEDTPDLRNKVAVDGVRAWLVMAGRRPLLSAEDEVNLAMSIEAGLFAEEALSHAEADGSAIDPDLERDYRVIMHEGQRDKTRFIEANLLLVVSVAKRFIGRGIDFQDLIQEGNISLQKSVEKFDYRLGNRFSTFATTNITLDLRRCFDNTSRLIRVPVEVAQEISTIKRTAKDLTESLGRRPTNSEIAAERNTTPEHIWQMLDYDQAPRSFEEVIGRSSDGSELRLGDVLTEPTPEEDSAILERRNALIKVGVRALLDKLSNRERDVLVGRYGLDGLGAKTQQQFADAAGLTKQGVSAAEIRAKKKMAVDPSARALYDQL